MRVETGRLRVVAAEAVEAQELQRDADLGEVGQSAPADPAALAADECSTPGAYIRAHRIRRGVSLDQLAAMTKIPRTQLELLEDDQFDALPGMVFVKGFLRCCARSLDLDPDTVLGLLYDRERERLRARRRESGANLPATPVKRSPSRPTKTAPRGRALGEIRDWIGDRLARLPSAQILMWLVVAILVAIVVLIAFTLAAGQAPTAPTGL